MTTAELLRRAAAALADGDSPLDNRFLTENGATVDQASSLAGLLATGALIVAAGIERRDRRLDDTGPLPGKSEKEEKQ